MSSVVQLAIEAIEFSDQINKLDIFCGGFSFSNCVNLGHYVATWHMKYLF